MSKVVPADIDINKEIATGAIFEAFNESLKKSASKPSPLQRRALTIMALSIAKSRAFPSRKY